mmetsp:Transcript_22249/g.44592  ORF Transcript_22249/g.44592 Transcript_22249/m.44592 type:complete len:93 (+) Transcript_22249:208-486(+)
MESYCRGEFQYDVVTVKEQHRSGSMWKERKNHPKWVILYFPPGESMGATNRTSASRRVQSGTKKWVCVDDTNCKIMEENRGGGTTCIHSPDI